MSLNINPLDIRDISIIDALPVYNYTKNILTVGCGYGRLEWHLYGLGYLVVATDIKRMVDWEDSLPFLRFLEIDILNEKTFVETFPVIICSQVLEHLKDYKIALKNLLKFTEIRLIITIPFEKSFNNPDHCNYWGDTKVKEFESICSPYSVSISRIRTKEKDIQLGQWCYLIIVDKRQLVGV